MSDKVVAVIIDENGLPIALEWVCGCYFEKGEPEHICSRHADPILLPQGEDPTSGDAFYHLKHPRYFSR